MTTHITPCCRESGDIIVRKTGINRSDNDQIIKLHNELQDEVRKNADRSALWLPDDSGCQLPHGSILVAVMCSCGKRFLAACTITKSIDDSTANFKKYTLKSLVVSPVVRRQGLGKEITRIAISHVNRQEENVKPNVDAYVRVYEGKYPAPSTHIMGQLGATLSEICTIRIHITDSIKEHFGDSLPCPDSDGTVELNYAKFNFS